MRNMNKNIWKLKTLKSINLTQQEAYGPYCSPEQRFLAINNLEENYDYISTLVQIFFKDNQ